jgi:hypothetical protein
VITAIENVSTYSFDVFLLLQIQLLVILLLLQCCGIQATLLCRCHHHRDVCKIRWFLGVQLRKQNVTFRSALTAPNANCASKRAPFETASTTLSRTPVLRLARYLLHCLMSPVSHSSRRWASRRLRVSSPSTASRAMNRLKHAQCTHPTWAQI